MRASTNDRICPGCGAPVVFAPLGEKGVVRLLRCKSCRLVFADRAFWSDPHAHEDYYAPANMPEAAYPLLPNATDRDRIGAFTRHLKRGAYLDYGGGLGSTGIAAQQSGFEVTVLEDSAKAVTDGQSHHPEIQWIRASDLSKAAAESFDVVSMFHVLEHIVDFGPLLDQIHAIMRPGGILVIEVPNWGSHVRKIRGLNWRYLLDHHVNYFDSDSLRNAVERHGFSRLDTEFRRTFSINEGQLWKEPLKKILCLAGLGEIVRCSFRRR